MGELLSLSCAFGWAASILLFKRLSTFASPIFVNLAKNSIGLFCFSLTLFFLDTPFPKSSWPQDFGLLFVSGFLGIAVGDTLYLKSLSYITVSQAAIIDCLFSPFVVLLSFLFLQESLTWIQLLGGTLILSAVISASISFSQTQGVSRRNFGLGALFNMLGVLAMAIGVVTMKPALTPYPLLWCIEIRLIAGVLGGILFLLFFESRKTIFLQKPVRNDWVILGAVGLLGGYINMLTWVGGTKFTQASLSSILNQTSTLFVLITARFFYSEKLTPRQWAQALIGFAGVMIIVLSK